MTFPTHTKRLFAYENIVVAATFLILLVSTGMQTAFGIFFKPLQSEFGWTKAMTSGAFSLSWILCGVLGIVMGRLNDRYGSRWVFTFCGISLGAGYMLMSLTTTTWHLYLFYGVLGGVGFSGMWVPAMSTVARWFVVRRNTAIAIVAVGGGLGALIAPPVANWLITRFDWTTSYLVMGAVVLLVIVAAAQIIKNPPLPVDESHLNAPRQTGTNSRSAVSLSLREAVHTVQFWLTFGMLFFFGFGAYLIQVHITPYAIEMGISNASAANILATIGGFTVVGRFALGGASEKTGNKFVFAAGFALMAASLFWLLAVKSELSLFLFAAAFGLSLGAAVVNPSLIAELFGISSHGLILGINLLSYGLGCAFGPFAGGYIFDITGGYQVAFLLSAVSALIGLVLTVMVTPVRLKTQMSKAKNQS